MTLIYEPAEDSYLLSETIKSEIPKLLIKNPDLKFLEIGAGSGINLKSAGESDILKQKIFSCDININAVNYCRLLGFNCIKSNLFEAFKGRLNVKGNLVPLQYDVIAFNPPYLPEDKREPRDSRKNTTGGKRGNEIIIEFLNQAKNHLNKNGILLLVVSSLAEEIDFNKLGYKFKKISEKKFFFETISVLKLELIE
ncbi:MAG: methyltransferase [Nanoarchaeota archaeon]